jgi:hypothetical protein
MFADRWRLAGQQRFWHKFRRLTGARVYLLAAGLGATVDPDEARTVGVERTFVPRVEVEVSEGEADVLR